MCGEDELWLIEVYMYSRSKAFVAKFIYTKGKYCATTFISILQEGKKWRSIITKYERLDGVIKIGVRSY